MIVGVIDIGSNALPALLSPAANLLMTLLTLVANYCYSVTMISEDLRKYVTAGGPVSVTPCSGQFATGVNDTGGAP
jgi:hypothetical protein